MKKKIHLAAILVLVSLPGLAIAQKGEKAHPKVVVEDAAARANLLGVHRFSLQWISWDYFGKVTVTERGGSMYIKGEQRGRGNTDFVTIDGVITRVAAKDLTFVGDIDIRVSTNNNGDLCHRDGKMTFRITGSRKYWRLQQMKNPCEDIVDYVDIFFR